MTPKEKAKELINRYYSITGPFTEAKQCALIAVDELELHEAVLLGYETDYGYSSEYWQEVKQEINRL